MPLSISRGNMYPFCYATQNFIKGECSNILHGFGCKYCMMKFGNLANLPQYKGPMHLYEDEFSVRYKPGEIHFIGSACDHWHPKVDDYDIGRFLAYCNMQSRQTPGAHPRPRFLFQSKNPGRFEKFVGELPVDTILGTTLETDNDAFYGGMSRAPSPSERMAALARVYSEAAPVVKFMVSVEPAMKFDLDEMVAYLVDYPLEFVSIGADSCQVLDYTQQPQMSEIRELVEALLAHKVKVYVKPNVANLPGNAREMDWFRFAGVLAEREKTERPTEVQTQLNLLV